MDWELNERYRATMLLVIAAILSFLLLALQKTSFVRHLRSWLVFATLPSQRLLSHGGVTLPTPVLEESTPALENPAGAVPTDESAGTQRILKSLADENERLHALLDLKKRQWPKAIAARVVGRDPQRWFQEVVLDKGRDDGIQLDSPVVAVTENREALIGRVIEVSGHVSKVMLIQDSLSAVAATVPGEKPEDGVVEGSNSHDLYLRYLDRGSQIKIGDAVVTSGLGKAFPAAIPIGWVEDVSLDARQLFLQARLRPAYRSAHLRGVLVLVSREEVVE